MADRITRKKPKAWVTRRTRRLTDDGRIATEKRTKITLPHYSIQDDCSVIEEFDDYSGIEQVVRNSG